MNEQNAKPESNPAGQLIDALLSAVQGSTPQEAAARNADSLPDISDLLAAVQSCEWPDEISALTPQVVKALKDSSILHDDGRVVITFKYLDEPVTESLAEIEKLSHNAKSDVEEAGSPKGKRRCTASPFPFGDPLADESMQSASNFTLSDLKRALCDRAERGYSRRGHRGDAQHLLFLLVTPWRMNRCKVQVTLPFLI